MKQFSVHPEPQLASFEARSAERSPCLPPATPFMRRRLYQGFVCNAVIPPCRPEPSPTRNNPAAGEETVAK